MHLHFTLLLHLQEKYYKHIVHFLSKNYTIWGINYLDGRNNFSTDLKTRSGSEETFIALCDSDQAIAYFHRKGFPVIAFSHDDNTDESLMASPWLILSADALTPEFLEEVYCRHYRLPLTITDTARCHLRELLMEDLPFLMELQKENETNPDGCFFPTDCEDPDLFLREYIQHQYPFYNYGLYAVLEKEQNTFLGIAGFSTPLESDVEDMDIEISYALLKRHQHKGYMSEVLESLIAREKENGRFDQLTARIHRSNHASIHMAKKQKISIILYE